MKEKVESLRRTTFSPTAYIYFNVLLICSGEFQRENTNLSLNLITTGESLSDNHLVYCSKFLLAALCHLLMCLEKLDGKHFPSLQDYQDTLSTTNLLVRKAEMVLSSHLANW